MKFCIYCGTKLNDNDRFCYQCGKQVFDMDEFLKEEGLIPNVREEEVEKEEVKIAPIEKVEEVPVERAQEESPV